MNLSSCRLARPRDVARLHLDAAATAADPIHTLAEALSAYGALGTSASSIRHWRLRRWLRFSRSP